MSRYYDFPGDKRRYVSVTSFLDIINKPFLLPWAAKMERELIQKLLDDGADAARIQEYIAAKQPYGYDLYSEVARDWGSKIHKAIDYTLKKLKLPKMTKEERKVYDKWLEWWKAQKFELLGAERVVKSTKYGYAGTLDALVRQALPGKPITRPVIDWKTGKSSYPEHELQNYAYQQALLEENVESSGGLLVYIPKDKEIYTKAVPKVTDELLAPALAALSLWRWANNKPWKEK